MAEHGHEFIIVKRHEEEEHEAHSSAWKVAHADFMTAMMAFFLIMWLINATDDKVRRGISNYFNPIHMSDGQSGMKGLAKPGEDSQKETSIKQSGKGNSQKDEFNPMKLSPGSAEAADAGSASAPAEGAAAGASPAGAAAGAGAQGKAASGGGILATADHVGSGAASASIGEPGGAAPASHGDTPGLAAKGQVGGGEGAYGGSSSGMLADFGDSKENAAFQDPYAVLAKLAAQYAAEHPTSKDIVVGDDRQPGVVGGEVDRDPFDPVYWQLAGMPDAKSDRPGRPGTAAVAPDGATPDAGGAAVVPMVKAELPDVALRPTQVAPVDGAAAKVDAAPAAGEPAAPAPAQASEPAKMEAAPPIAVQAKSAGDGQAEALPKAEPAKMEPAKIEAAQPEAPAKPAIDAATMDAAAAVREAVAKAIGPTLGADASPKVSVVATAEGVAIDLTDAANFSMFDVGSAVPKGKVVVLMEEVAKALANKPGDIIIRGHTDGRPFHSDMYDNWRLSAARAHMAYYMLTRGGLPESRFVRIEGAADRDLKTKSNPLAADNRRIEILLVPPKP
ncbi:MAG: OmpA family protein [Rhizobiales bacterium]|nr:OmpA family protein [Hyphomicrobiales bacterium]